AAAQGADVAGERLPGGEAVLPGQHQPGVVDRQRGAVAAEQLGRLVDAALGGAQQPGGSLLVVPQARLERVPEVGAVAPDVLDVITTKPPLGLARRPPARAPGRSWSPGVVTSGWRWARPFPRTGGGLRPPCRG